MYICVCISFGDYKQFIYSFLFVISYGIDLLNGSHLTSNTVGKHKFYIISKVNTQTSTLFNGARCIYKCKMILIRYMILNRIDIICAFVCANMEVNVQFHSMFVTIAYFNAPAGIRFLLIV